MTDDEPIALEITRTQLDAVLHLHRCPPSIGGGPCRSCDVAQNWTADARSIVEGPKSTAPSAPVEKHAEPRARIADRRS